MLRISLIIALVASIAALVISQTKVAQKITGLTTELDSTKQTLSTSQEAERKAKKDAKDATTAADQAKKTLESTKTELASASEKADQQEKRANELAGRVDKLTQERNDAQSDLAKWKASGLTLEQIAAMIVENKKLLGENNGLKEENKVLGRQLTQTKAELGLLTGTIDKVPLPPGLKGKIIAVDPKYEFVVLNIGESQGVLKRGEMLINRSGRLVAKVRILSVEPNRCVANILPDWKQGEPMEGDVAIVGL
jgi:predicted RNase H-like nuclease (RuvC/YqgF family)